jgi:hypothetical protein
MCTLFNISPDPPVKIPLSVRAPLEPIKGRACTLDRGKLSKVPRTYKFPKLTSNTTYSGRRVLCSGGSNHSKPLWASRVHTTLDLAFLDFPQTHPKLGLGGCFPPPGWRNLPTTGNISIHYTQPINVVATEVSLKIHHSTFLLLFKLDAIKN